MAIALLEEREECRIGHTGTVLVIVWFTEPTVPALERFETHHRALAAKFGKITLVSILQGGLKPPGPEVRARIDQYTPELQKQRHGMIAVMLATGLAAIFIRSFLAALALVSTEHMRVAKTLEAAAAEVHRMPGQDEVTRANVALASEFAIFLALPPVGQGPTGGPTSTTSAPS